MGGNRHILFAGGGTIGHIAPLLAVMEATYEQDPDIKMSYIGTAADVRLPILKDSYFIREHVSIHTIAAGKLNRYLTARHIGESLRFMKGMLQAWTILRKERPDCIFAKGGYVTVPVVFAAARLRIPVYCHESDVIPGLANRLVSKHAVTIFTAYPERYYAGLPVDKLRYVGQPVRKAFFEKDGGGVLRIEGREINREKPIVVIIGGSQGAHRLNELVSASWGRYLEVAQVVHICGTRDLQWLQEKRTTLSPEASQNLWLVPSVQDELPLLFRSARLVVSRAGGIIAELAATGTPAVLVPLSTAAQDHQRANAEVFSKEGAAIVFDEVKGTGEELFDLIGSLLQDPQKQQDLSAKIQAFSRPDAASQMAAALTE